MNSVSRLLPGLAAGLLMAGGLPVPAAAAPIAISYTSFGSLPGATFGGSGIPNDAVAVTTIVHEGATITLGLTATERFSNPEVGNDGAGTFFAEPGQNGGDPLNPLVGLQGATWNFGFYIEIVGGTFGDYDIDLLYEFDPGTDTDESLFGRVDLNAFVAPSATLAQGSQNLLFSFLSSPIPGAITPPAGSFDPFASGQYTFALRASLLNGIAPQTLGTSAIQVEVAPVPEPATLTMVALGGAVALARRRRRR